MKTVMSITIALFMLIGCRQKSNTEKYEDLLKTELTSGKKKDSIFLGIYLGMPQQDFFKHCWEMNQRGILNDGSDGMGNMYVLYKLKNELNYPASMNFYPGFNNNKIWRMQVNIEYEGWAPWNKYLGADSLLPDVLKMCNKWYSGENSFIQLPDKNKGIKYVKVDGNRRITVKKADDTIVKIEYTDMQTEENIKNKHEN